jgi:hypothetical protein
MAFAIFFELGDLSTMVGSARAPSLPNTLRNRVTTYWNAGLRNWDTAPLASAPGDTACPLCRRVIITSGTLADFIQLLKDVAAFFGTKESEYLIALANEISQPHGGVEPWPPA